MQSTPPYYMIPMQILPVPSSYQAQPGSSFPQYIPYPIPINPSQLSAPFNPVPNFQSSSLSNPKAGFNYSTLAPGKLKKLVKIQAVARGWLARKKIVPRKRVTNYACYRVMESLVDQYVEDKLLIDIILEIISKFSTSPDFVPNTPNERIAGMIAQVFENSLVHRICEEVAKDVINSTVNHYLNVRSRLKIIKGEFDPLIIICNNYADLLIDRLAEPLVKECISECSFEYMHEAYGIAVINSELPNILRGVVNEAGWEVGMERFVEECIDDEVQNTVLEAIPQAVQEAKFELDIKAKEKAFEIMLQRMILEIAVDELRVLDDKRRGFGNPNGREMEIHSKNLIANQGSITNNIIKPLTHYSKPQPVASIVPDSFGNTLADYPYQKQSYNTYDPTLDYARQLSHISAPKPAYSRQPSIPNPILSKQESIISHPILSKQESIISNPIISKQESIISNSRFDPISHKQTVRASASVSLAKEEDPRAHIDSLTNRNSYLSRASADIPKFKSPDKSIIQSLLEPKRSNLSNAMHSIGENHGDRNLEALIYGGSRPKQ
jgi:hypothetical protein